MIGLSTSRPSPDRRLIALCVAWAFISLGAMFMLWRYELTAGPTGIAPAHLPPALVRESTSDGKFKLLIALHPQCPCSAATVRELSKVAARCGPRLQITAYMIRPTEMPEGWEQTALWRDAAAIPGVAVLSDVGGLRSATLGAKTSGEAALYSPGGELLFQGGITESRGHDGDNDGSDAIVAFVQNAKQIAHSPTTTSVFGCPLNRSAAKPATCDLEGISQ